jgi:hypothetical protein
MPVLHRRWPIAAALVLFLASCSGKKGTEPDGQDLRLEVLPDEEAELMALYLSGQIEAPMALYERIRNDLQTIRHDYRYIPELDSVHFVSPVEPGFLLLEISADGLQRLLNHENPAWDSLNVLYHPSFDSLYQEARFPGRLNSSLLAEAYGKIEEVESVGLAVPSTNGGLGYHVNVGWLNDEIMLYAFQRAYRESPVAPPTMISFWCFYASPSGVIYVGRYDFDSILPGADTPVWWHDFCPSIRTLNNMRPDLCVPLDYAPPFEITDDDPSTFRWDYIAVDSLRIVGDMLCLYVWYSGGGGIRHEFALFMSPAAFAESDPVQASLYLAHDNNGDLLRAIVRDTLTFDISPIAGLYELQYGQPGDIILNLWNYEQTEAVQITYLPR